MQMLNNMTIDKVVLRQEKDDWKRYSVWVGDPDWKDVEFTYFQKGKKVTPEPTIECNLEIEHNEQYNSYSINFIKLTVQSTQEPPKPLPTVSKPKPIQTEPDSKISYYFSYSTKQTCAAIEAFGEKILMSYEGKTFEEIMTQITHTTCRQAIKMWRVSEDPTLEDIL